MSGAKGLVLAAGLGTRLRPLTTLYPKPLIPFLGSTPLEIALGRLAAAGIADVAVNSHYLPEQVTTAMARNPFSQRLVQSHEPELLGTGGAYNPLREWLGDDDLVVLNGDTVSDVALAPLLAHHRSGGFAATMALLPAVIAGEKAVYHRAGAAVALGKNLTPAQSGGGAAANFACIHILTKRFLDLMPKVGVVDIIKQGYEVAFAAGIPIGAALHHGMWHDLRDPQFYWLALIDVMARSGLRNFVARGAEVDGTARLGANVVVEHGARIESGAQVENAVILPGAVVRKNQTVERQIVLPMPHPAILIKG